MAQTGEVSAKDQEKARMDDLKKEVTMVSMPLLQSGVLTVSPSCHSSSDRTST